jgi:futalosine hydrolase
MFLKVLLIAATDAEAEALRRIPEIQTGPDGFLLGKCAVSLLVTGVGSMATSWAMTKWFSSNTKPDLAINIGIAGSYNMNISIGDVVIPVSDCFADAGIEDGDSFITIEEAGFADPDRFPFKKGRIVSENIYCTAALTFLRPVTAITVNSATGSETAIGRLLKKYNPDIETMEGATFFYICSGEKLPFLALRSISNRVEPRNKDKWNIPLALNNLSEKLNDFLLMV